jgi:hypothetical protein
MDNIICIPYRNRAEHYKTFLQKAWPFLQTHLPNTQLVFVEQEGHLPFNRGMLLNIGFQEFGKYATWFFTHDIDLCPHEQTIQTVYNRQDNDILGIYNAHAKSLGGICKFRSSKFQTMNGFPNYCWGWGIEDRALFYRAKTYAIKMTQIMKTKINLTALPHKSNVVTYTGKQLQIHQKEEDIFNKGTEKEKFAHIQSSGLNTLTYTLLEKKEIQPCVFHIKVIIKE